MNFTVNIDFTYEIKSGTKLTGRMECLDYDQTGDIITAVIEWCETNGFQMRRVDINLIDKNTDNVMEFGGKL